MKKVLPFSSDLQIKTYSYFADYLGVLKANGYEIDNLLEQHFLFMSYLQLVALI